MADVFLLLLSNGNKMADTTEGDENGRGQHDQEAQIDVLLDLARLIKEKLARKPH